MQKLRFLGIFICLTCLSCTKSNDDNSGTNDPQVTAGKWKVSWFWDKDKEETSDFNGYSFEFKSDGTLVASLPDNSTKSGTWSVSSTKFIITIGGTYALDEMTDDWLLLEKSDNLIRLKDDNATHLEELHLEKI